MVRLELQKKALHASEFGGTRADKNTGLYHQSSMLVDKENHAALGGQLEI
jgi:hypothetical protein